MRAVVVVVVVAGARRYARPCSYAQTRSTAARALAPRVESCPWTARHRAGRDSTTRGARLRRALRRLHGTRVARRAMRAAPRARGSPARRSSRRRSPSPGAGVVGADPAATGSPSRRAVALAAARTPQASLPGQSCGRRRRPAFPTSRPRHRLFCPPLSRRRATARRAWALSERARAPPPITRAGTTRARASRGPRRIGRDHGSMARTRSRPWWRRAGTGSSAARADARRQQPVVAARAR